MTPTYTPDALQVEITDDGLRASNVNGHGFGTIGMSERARLYGGTLEAGPRAADDGWRVCALFPLEHGGVEG